ncbi:VWA domain-containing protein [Siminovitchia acidinfaciens]|uniref:VWA domain-containing protein n=1 Tax=Siminovitchia acidinfaciens TaxID=2321395 RepID=A0A429Y025_9BACI|nr:VWA domain-containing protein [Siminovitchia acidinfaciens]RST74367.1 VWA domain-containing protein [Siminovitchia acidinfaciens]
MKLRNYLFICLSLFIVLSGCGQEKENKLETTTVEKDKEENDRPENHRDENVLLDATAYQSNELEDILMQVPGKFSSENYDELKVKELIDQWPRDLEMKEYYEQLLALVAEDYRPYKKYFEDVDTSFEENSSEPGSKNMDVPSEKKVNIQILFDSSGSMNGEVGGKQKMKLAKDAVQSFVSELPEQVQISLRVYGHKGTGSDADKPLSCKSTEVVYPFKSYDQKQFSAALDQFSPAGWTPLAGAIQAAEEDLKELSGDDVENILYVVSDGVETCDGDPVKAAKQINQSDIKGVVNIIGYDVDNEGQEALKEVAKAGAGKYETVSSQQQFEDFFEKEKELLIDAWYEWENTNVDNVYESESSRLDEINTKESEMRDAQEREEKRLEELTKYIGDHLKEDPVEIRLAVADRGRELRIYVGDTARDLRIKLSDNARNQRIDTRDKALDERIKIRNEED